jgi:hypothetical protein
MLILLYKNVRQIKKFKYFSEANSLSKSNSSKGGGGSSLKIGGNTAGSSPNKGVSNYGGIKVNYLCSTFSYL